MRPFLALALTLAAAFGPASEFRHPWTDPTRAIVVDPYRGNTIDWNLLATDPRVVAIVHKATEGASVDPAYSGRKAEAVARGYEWGSYHLGRPGDPVAQADFYLATTQP